MVESARDFANRHREEKWQRRVAGDAPHESPDDAGYQAPDADEEVTEVQEPDEEDVPAHLVLVCMQDLRAALRTAQTSGAYMYPASFLDRNPSPAAAMAVRRLDSEIKAAHREGRVVSYGEAREKAEQILDE